MSLNVAETFRKCFLEVKNTLLVPEEGLVLYTRPQYTVLILNKIESTFNGTFAELCKGPSGREGGQLEIIDL